MWLGEGKEGSKDIRSQGGLEVKKKSDLGLQQLPQKLQAKEGCLGQFNNHDVMEATPLRSRSTQLPQIHRSTQQCFSPGTNCAEVGERKAVSILRSTISLILTKAKDVEKTSRVFLNN